MKELTHTGQFESVTIVLPVINETYSLEQTIEIIKTTCDPEDICEYLIVVCERTTPESLEVCQVLNQELAEKCRIHHQKLPFIGGAMREAFELSNASHTIMMSTDLETDPNVVQQFICLAKENPASIITASRWLKGGNFEGYNFLKLLANYLFQKMFALFYCSHLTDLTYAYRIFPTSLIQAIKWEELKHPFFLETITKPIRLGVKIIEIPTVWRCRTEGESQNSFFANFAYFKTAFRTRFYSRMQIILPDARYPL